MTNHRTFTEVQECLREAGLRLTKQRLALGRLLFEGPDRHVTAEMFYLEAQEQGIRVSLATIYNTLHQFTEAGLLRRVIVGSGKVYFDNNISEHHHFYLENKGDLVDIPGNTIQVIGLPPSPDGTEVDRVDVIVRLKGE